MQDARTDSAAERFGLSLVYWGEEDAAALRPTLREATRILEGLTLDYEILIPGAADAARRRCAVEPESIHNARVRYVAAPDALTYGNALRLAASQARFSHVALVACADDLASLPELVGL
ncbi:MAG TPA: hypothetical protein VKI17_09495, partial [Gemmataceae bacterium]|nr:hypothetical protein [Gemmataceae bacterium]